MGIIFGRFGANEPIYNTLKSIPYEIRTYESCFIAETTTSVENEAFGKLAKYFGVYGSAENDSDDIVSSVPSVSGIPMEGRGEKISMMGPVLTENGTMQFILPSKYKYISVVPVPIDPDVAIKQLPKRTVAVLRFYGWASATRCQHKFESLRQMLLDDDLVTSTSVSPLSSHDSQSVRGSSCRTVDLSTPLLQTQGPSFVLAQYHSLLPLPCCRCVEVWIPLDPRNDRVAELLRNADDPTYSTRNAVETLMEAHYLDDPLDAEYGSEEVNEEVHRTLEVSTSVQVRRRARQIVSSAEKFLGSG